MTGWRPCSNSGGGRLKAHFTARRPAPFDNCRNALLTAELLHEALAAAAGYARSVRASLSRQWSDFGAPWSTTPPSLEARSPAHRRLIPCAGVVQGVTGIKAGDDFNCSLPLACGRMQPTEG